MDILVLCRREKLQMPPSRASFSDQPEEDGNHDADQQASDDREMKTKVSPVEMNVAGKPAQVFANSEPKQQADARDDHSADKKQFSKLVHWFECKILRLEHLPRTHAK
jgi:hypothetical protein